MSKKSKDLGNEVAGLHMERDGDDLVIRVQGCYATLGVETNSDKDTRKVFSSPGRFYWFQDDSPLQHQNPDNRRLGIKVVGILSQPREARKEQKKETDGPAMSAVSFG